MKLHRYIDHDSQMTPIDFQVSRIIKLHRYIDHDLQMTPIDFQVTRSKIDHDSQMTVLSTGFLSGAPRVVHGVSPPDDDFFLI
ncbi:hypothetical protein DPMN_025219 [Dreissena polymorpha]|uniref:Uncharacterized protein n=1 Tax=Dreissena polymorpha TaxID=45954 RepID=A0A9D4LPF8_DREPO|nr:hypothetical protein DPMN_025219 [Dreissena polymorpha]